MEFEFGDYVYCFMFGTGKIKNERRNEKDYIAVDFIDSEKRRNKMYGVYTCNGKLMEIYEKINDNDNEHEMVMSVPTKVKRTLYPLNLTVCNTKP